MMAKGQHMWANSVLSKTLEEIKRKEHLTNYEAQCRLVEHAKIGQHIEKVSFISNPIVQPGFEKDKKKKRRFMEQFL